MPLFTGTSLRPVAAATASQEALASQSVAKIVKMLVSIILSLITALSYSALLTGTGSFGYAVRTAIGCAVMAQSTVMPKSVASRQEALAVGAAIAIGCAVSQRLKSL